MKFIDRIKENMKIAAENFEASNRNAYIDYAFKILPKSEIARYNSHVILLTKGFLRPNFSAKEIKLQEMNFDYFTEEEKILLLKVIVLVEMIQEKYLADEITLEEAEMEVAEIRKRIEVKETPYKTYIKK